MRPRDTRTNTRKGVTAEAIRRVLHYEPATGIFTWLVRVAPRVQIGDVAGSVSVRGYVVISIKNVSYKAHRLAWLYMTGEWPEREVDHRNLNKADNAWVNLRPATPRQQAGNLGQRRNNTSGIKGVHYRKRRWVAQISIKGRRVHLGQFSTREQAAECYAAAAAEHFGEFARVVVSRRRRRPQRKSPEIESAILAAIRKAAAQWAAQ